MDLVQTQREILSILTPLREYLQNEYHERLDRVILFGSQARGDATASSDIDVLIVLQDPLNTSLEIDRTSHFIAQLCLDHNLLISRLFIPRSRFENENSPLLRNIRQEGIVL
jgi:uncharacterized protein